MCTTAMAVARSICKGSENCFRKAIRCQALQQRSSVHAQQRSTVHAQQCSTVHAQQCSSVHAQQRSTVHRPPWRFPCSCLGSHVHLPLPSSSPHPQNPAAPAASTAAGEVQPCNSASGGPPVRAVRQQVQHGRTHLGRALHRPAGEPYTNPQVLPSWCHWCRVRAAMHALISITDA